MGRTRASGTLVKINASAGEEREPAIILDHPALNHDDRRSIVTREPGEANHALGQTVDRTALRIRWHGTLYFYEEVALKNVDRRRSPGVWFGLIRIASPHRIGLCQ